MAQNIRKVLQSPYHQIEDAVRQAMEGVTLRSMIDEFESIVHPPEEKEDC